MNYKCKLCHRTFKDKSEVRRHIAQYHDAPYSGDSVYFTEVSDYSSSSSSSNSSYSGGGGDFGGGGSSGSWD